MAREINGIGAGLLGISKYGVLDIRRSNAGSLHGGSSGKDAKVCSGQIF
jgi:hypothetical protein